MKVTYLKMMLRTGHVVSHVAEDLVDEYQLVSVFLMAV